MSEDESEQEEEEEEDEGEEEEQMNEGPVAEESHTLHLRVGQSRGLPCTIHYELYGTGPHKILFIMGINLPFLLLFRSVFLLHVDTRYLFLSFFYQGFVCPGNGGSLKLSISQRCQTIKFVFLITVVMGTASLQYYFLG